MRKLLRSVVVLGLVASGGCTFGYPREARDPSFTALPPCMSGDVCGVAFDSGGLWVRDTVAAAR